MASYDADRHDRREILLYHTAQKVFLRITMLPLCGAAPTGNLFLDRCDA